VIVDTAHPTAVYSNVVDNAQQRIDTHAVSMISIALASKGMPNKEATARIKINKLLEAAGWRFFPEGNALANICLEAGVTIKSTDLDALGDNFEKTRNGFIDFLLLDAKGF